jgi:hypothetical protein
MPEADPVLSWNEKDPNRAKILAVPPEDPVFAACFARRPPWAGALADPPAGHPHNTPVAGSAVGGGARAFGRHRGHRFLITTWSRDHAFGHPGAAGRGLFSVIDKAVADKDEAARIKRGCRKWC